MRILVVDDSKVARAVVKKLLAELGYTEVAEAGDGMEALPLLAGGDFDLVVSDWSMPNLDGLGLVRAIRAGECPSVPILIVSSESYVTRIMDVMRAGAQAYIRKPFRAEQLAGKIREIAKKSEMAEQGHHTSLAGRLEEIGFPELVQFLSSCQMDGRLTVDDAVVEMREGELHAAHFRGLAGDAAVFEVAALESGEFRFQPDDGLVVPNVSTSTTQLLIEAMKRRDEKAVG